MQMAQSSTGQKGSGLHRFQEVLQLSSRAKIERSRFNPQNRQLKVFRWKAEIIGSCLILTP